MNSNCLEGFACPRCGSDGPFDITATTVATMYDDGCDGTADIEWEDTSPCVCKSCGHGAQVRAFHRPDAL
jgi:hypothetical protein